MAITGVENTPKLPLGTAAAYALGCGLPVPQKDSPGTWQEQAEAWSRAPSPSPTAACCVTWAAPSLCAFTASGQRRRGLGGHGEASGCHLEGVAIPAGPVPHLPELKGPGPSHSEEEGSEAWVPDPISIHPPRSSTHPPTAPPPATHVKPASSPSCEWQVPPFPQGLLEQLSRDTSQSRPWGRSQRWGPQGDPAASEPTGTAGPSAARPAGPGGSLFSHPHVRSWMKCSLGPPPPPVPPL